MQLPYDMNMPQNSYLLGAGEVDDDEVDLPQTRDSRMVHNLDPMVEPFESPKTAKPPLSSKVSAKAKTVA